jgi:hypothetical protein
LTYSNGSRFDEEQGLAPAGARLTAVRGWSAWVLAMLLLVAAGAGYRVMAARLKTALSTPIELPVPLSAVPGRIGDWVGRELPVPPSVKVYMEANFADDFVSRRYERQGYWADVYVVYCSSRPAGIVGHQPRVCFPANGWVWEQTVPSEIVSRSGRTIKCLMHRFHKPSPAYQQAIVLNFYVVNGQVTLSERSFSSFFGRRPNISGDPARYVAQVQVSSVLEHSARAVATEIADTILAFLPDQEGHVGATSLVDVHIPVGDAQNRKP